LVVLETWLDDWHQIWCMEHVGHKHTG
jgi:hypothetical protein